MQLIRMDKNDYNSKCEWDRESYREIDEWMRVTLHSSNYQSYSYCRFKLHHFICRKTFVKNEYGTKKGMWKQKLRYNLFGNESFECFGNSFISVIFYHRRWCFRFPRLYRRCCLLLRLLILRNDVYIVPLSYLNRHSFLFFCGWVRIDWVNEWRIIIIIVIIILCLCIYNRKLRIYV